MTLDKVKAIVNEMENMRSKAMDALREQFFEHLVTYFEKYSDLETIGIIGYTPGFNDGEPCNYSCMSDAYSLKINGYNEDDMYGDDPDRKITKERRNEIAKDVGAFTGAFPDDFYLQAFGDNTQTIFRRDGSKESEDYDCGH